MPAPRKIQTQFVPSGNIENLKATRAFVAEPIDDDSNPTLGLETVVMDGEYAGTPVTDYLNIQESKKNPGELYISKKGKMGATLRNVLNVDEYNAMVDQLNGIEETREAWLPIIAEAINTAENPVLRAVIVQNEPKDEANLRNKLTKKYEEIGPYIDPAENQKILETREQIAGNGNKKAAAKKLEEEMADDLSESEKASMERALG